MRGAKTTLLATALVVSAAFAGPVPAAADPPTPVRAQTQAHIQAQPGPPASGQKQNSVSSLMRHIRAALRQPEPNTAISRVVDAALAGGDDTILLAVAEDMITAAAGPYVRAADAINFAAAAIKIVSRAEIILADPAAVTAIAAAAINVANVGWSVFPQQAIGLAIAANSILSVASIRVQPNALSARTLAEGIFARAAQPGALDALVSAAASAPLPPQTAAGALSKGALPARDAKISEAIFIPQIGEGADALITVVNNPNIPGSPS